MNNDIVIEAWNTVLFDKFSRFRHLLIDGLSSHSEEALHRHRHNRGSSVLDIGCGFGDSTLRIAETVGKKGRAYGVDCAANFIDAGCGPDTYIATAIIGRSAFELNPRMDLAILHIFL